MNSYDLDDIFSGGSPLIKFVDVVQNANRNVCEFEIDNLFERFCAYELYAEQNGLDDKQLSNFIFENADEIQNRKNSTYIEITAGIVTKAE